MNGCWGARLVSVGAAFGCAVALAVVELPAARAEGSASLSVAPMPSARPPLVLVHGWMPNGTVVSARQGISRYAGSVSGSPIDPAYTSWGIAGSFSEAGYDVWLAHLDTSLLATPSLDDNGDRLADQIDLVYEASGNQRIAVVAHSMGGVVARACIASHDRCGARVSALYTLGSPHAGIRARSALSAALPSGAGENGIDSAESEAGSALIELWYYLMPLWNRRHPNSADVQYTFVGGDRGSTLRTADGENDGVVGAYSAVGWAYPRASENPAGWSSSSEPARIWTDESHYPGAGMHAYYEDYLPDADGGGSKSFHCIQWRQGKEARPAYCADAGR